MMRQALRMLAAVAGLGLTVVAAAGADLSDAAGEGDRAVHGRRARSTSWRARYRTSCRRASSSRSSWRTAEAPAAISAPRRPPRRPRRLHAADVALHDAHRQPGALQQAAVRTAEGFPRPVGHGQLQADDGRASVRAGAHARGIRRLRQEGADHLRPCGAGQRRPSGDGIFQDRRGLRDRSGAVPGQRAAGDRSGVRAGEGRVRRHHRRGAPCPRRASQGPRDFRRRAARRSRRTCRRWRRPAIRTSRSIPTSLRSRPPALPMRSPKCSNGRSSRRCKRPTCRKSCGRTIVEAVGSSAADATARLQAETALWARVVKSANMHVN